MSDKPATEQAAEKVVALSRNKLKGEREELLQWIKAANRTHTKKVRKRIAKYFTKVEARIKELEKPRH